MLAALAVLAAAACPSTDARQLLRDAGQGFNGRVLEIHADRLVIEAESRFDAKSVKFGEHVTVYGRSLPATLRGRIGIVVRRRDGKWRASRCDVIPGARMANAIHGQAPCPKPRVKIAGVTSDRRTATLSLRLSGDVTGLRFNWAGVVVQRAVSPGQAVWSESHTFRDSGSRQVRVRVSGAAGLGCGRSRSLTAEVTQRISVD